MLISREYVETYTRTDITYIWNIIQIINDRNQLVWSAMKIIYIWIFVMNSFSKSTSFFTT